jgi:hypothetical protein
MFIHSIIRYKIGEYCPLYRQEGLVRSPEIPSIIKRKATKKEYIEYCVANGMGINLLTHYPLGFYYEVYTN